MQVTEAGTGGRWSLLPPPRWSPGHRTGSHVSTCPETRHSVNTQAHFCHLTQKYKPSFVSQMLPSTHRGQGRRCKRRGGLWSIPVSLVLVGTWGRERFLHSQKNRGCRCCPGSRRNCRGVGTRGGTTWPATVAMSECGILFPAQGWRCRSARGIFQF